MPERLHQIGRMDIVAHLLALVAEYRVFAALHIALGEIAEEAMQLDPGMVRAGQAAATQAASRQIEVAAIFLHHHIRRHLGSAEYGMLALIDRKALRDPMFIGRIRVIPA